ncbi:MAG TPA: hypothetical protein VK845_00375 [Gemmatimonadales bacterium]|nr:hypothetical protein [Gemmatimonadales bacterium]
MRLLATLIGAGALAMPVAAQAPSLTIYNDGRVLVRRSIPARVPRGPSTHRIEVGALDLATVFSRDSLVTITAASYDGATDMQSVIRRSIGRRITFRYGGVKDTVSAKVLAVDPERYEMPDGTVTFSMPGTPQFPRDLVVVDPVLSLSVESRRAREGLDLGYFTSGGTWQASYQVILGAKAARVQGSAVVAVDRLSVEGASVQLLAGSVGRAAQMRDETRFRRNVAAVAEMTVAGVAAIEERVGEFHLYTLPGTLNLAPGIETSRALFEPATTGYERRYVVRGFLPYRGPLVQTGEEPQSPVEVRYRIERKSGSEFGDTPLPGGVIRLYQPDEGGRLQLVGEANVDHTPAGRDVTVSAGLAFDITAKRVQTSYATVRQGRYTVATADYEVTLANATDQAVTVDVLEERFGEWSILESSVPAEKVSSTVTRFRVTVPAKGEATLTYQVRARW